MKMSFYSSFNLWFFVHSKFDLSNESDRQRVEGEKLLIAQLIQLIERILFSLSQHCMNETILLKSL